MRDRRPVDLCNGARAGRSLACFGRVQAEKDQRLCTPTFDESAPLLPRCVLLRVRCTVVNRFRKNSFICFTILPGLPIAKYNLVLDLHDESLPGTIKASTHSLHHLVVASKKLACCAVVGPREIAEQNCRLLLEGILFFTWNEQWMSMLRNNTFLTAFASTSIDQALLHFDFASTSIDQALLHFDQRTELSCFAKGACSSFLRLQELAAQKLASDLLLVEAQQLDKSSLKLQAIAARLATWGAMANVAHSDPGRFLLYGAGLAPHASSAFFWADYLKLSRRRLLLHSSSHGATLSVIGQMAHSKNAQTECNPYIHTYIHGNIVICDTRISQARGRVPCSLHWADSATQEFLKQGADPIQPASSTCLLL